MAISDLTGTTWRLNNTITIAPTTYSVDIEYSTYSFSTLRMSVQPLPGEKFLFGLYFDSYMVVEGETSTLNTHNEEFTITGGTDVTKPDLISWLQANATQVVAGNTYSLSNSLSNASAEDITFIIQPDEGYALPDTITVTNGTLVSYNKATGEVVVSGASAEISVECEASVTLISFEVGGVGNTLSYQAEDGMTWAEWVASDYNTAGFEIYNGGVFTPGRMYSLTANGNTVMSNDVIIANYNYLTSGGAGK